MAGIETHSRMSGYPSSEEIGHPSSAFQKPTASKPVSPTPSILTLSPRKDHSSTPLNPALPPRKDLSLWYEKSCRPVLLEFIQNRAIPEVESLARSEEVLKNLLYRYLKERSDEGREGMHFLDLSGTLQVNRDLRKATYSEFSSRPRSASSSQSSLNSLSSQVSDSDLNDVQQSIEVLLRDLREGHQELVILEKGKVWSKFGSLSNILPLRDKAKELQERLNEVIHLLHKAQNNIEGIGFPDLGLELNWYNERYRELVLKYLQTARKSNGRLDLLNRLFRSSKRLEHFSDKYSDLINIIESTKIGIREALKRGEATRDVFLTAGLAVIDEVARMVAQDVAVSVYDTFSENVLVMRGFESEGPMGRMRRWVGLGGFSHRNNS